MSYSGGGTLTLPSPTHTHHVDVTSAVRTIRRSLSRSPSKFRFVTSRSGSSSPVSAQSPSPKSSNTPLDNNSNSQSAPSHTPSPLARPFPPSVKLSLRSSTRPKMTSPRASYGRTSPKSPLKRALSETSDSGNSTRRSSKESLGGPGSSKGSTSSPPLRMSLDTDRESSQMESFGPINQVLARFTEENHDPSNLSGISSPLKRSDAIMNLDQASLGSPVAKRRSLHASANLGHEFSVFDQGNVPSTFDIHDDGNHEYELSPISFTAGNPALVNALGAMPRRSSSLRKSTLQQRHGDKQTSWGRKHAAQLEAAKMNSIEFPSDLSTPIASKNRPRLSLDQFLPPPPRDSPFSNQGSLPNPSAHMIPPPPERQAHPLSRTMTQSSSNSSICVEDESPTHVPVHFRDHPRPRIDFSKSLPAGALRPQMLAAIAREEGDSFSTPPNYKAVKPLPAAFMSTGLISKVNRFPEEPQPVHGAKGQMPDTPCKKQNNVFATYPQPVPGSAIAKARHIRHSFGTPSTPFNPNGNSKTKSIFSKRNVFGSSFGQAGLSRRGSFLSTDGDDLGSSPLADEKQDCLMTGDDDFPPTPTKQATTSIGSTDEPASIKPLSLRGLPSSTSVIGMDLLSGDVSNSSKSNLLTLDGNKYDSTSTIPRGDPASPSGFRMSSRASSSFHRSRTSRGSSMFLPMSLHSTPPSHSYTLPAIKLSQAKIGLPAPASPLDRVDFTQGSSPITPQAPCSNDMLPPDPSRLSISNTKDEQAKRLFSDKGSTRPPATPTTGRESFSQFGERRLSVTPINNSFSPDLDDALLSRFDKVELIGNGEFSTVYKVSAPSTNTSSRNTMPQFAPTGSPLAEKSLTPVAGHEQVFAVKKARQAYQGVRDRGRKLREVEVLKALNNHDHIVHFIDHWEARDHLYIQTEYCEEGSLDTFLSQVGRKGRLDDFRIWKIMLETSQGLKYIHDSGFIHLDLKPANILITFEGALRIADFGMAVSWPAPADIESEGDREYIGPEILLGNYDKPADVFALGLIMLEIAGNVQLPDNGPTWQRLRCGDMSDVPSLTFSTATTIVRDATGIPVDDSDTSMDSFSFDEDTDIDFGSHESFRSSMLDSHKRRSMPCIGSPSHNAGNLFGSTRRGELDSAPDFMRDQKHEYALDSVVRWMISPETSNRPTISDVIASPALQWVEGRRRAGATVFEGNWGPADEILADDVEMMDI